jgi:hypothetical protein
MLAPNVTVVVPSDRDWETNFQKFIIHVRSIVRLK